MKSQWWNFGQAVNYVQANYPCENGVAANELLANKVVDGSLTVRYGEGGLVIQPDEWVRNGHIDLKVEGAGISHMDVEYKRASIEKLCQKPPSPGNGGRPLKDWEKFLIEVIGIANGIDGLPDKQADLERTMLEWAQSNMDDPPLETAVRDMVSKIYRRTRLK